MKTMIRIDIAAGIALFGVLQMASANDPRSDSWLTKYSGQYARIYTTDVNRTNGTASTVWTNGNYIESLPSYCGVQEIYSSTDWIYVRSTGLGSHVMGAWYLDANHQQLFNSFPTNQHLLYRIPHVPTVPATKSQSGAGAAAIGVDGVAIYNNWDANYWNGTTEVASGTHGYWNRDAYVNEALSFDPAYAHQPASGQYHYHASPVALRYLLGDHISFNSTTKIYTESTNAVTAHSPILGWAPDGYPIYGPYGYSVSNNASSGVRRMVSGYVLRNGQYGTSNLTANGRTTIPAWAARLYQVSSNILAGPNVSTTYPLGRYMEDNDYLGDHGYAQGGIYDLDEYNGRYCVTPEFPGGTYAYFISISSNGTPVYPYLLGFGYYGNPTGGTVTAITNSVVTNYLGSTNLASTMNAPVKINGTVTLTWSALEGGKYQLEASTNLSSWTVLAANLSPNKITGGYTNSTSLDAQFYQEARTSLANFDGAGSTLFATPTVAPGGSAARGQTVILTITLPSSPPNPPAGAPISYVTVGTNIASSATCTAQGTVQAVVALPSNTPTGAQNVTVQFNPNPNYVLTGGFTVNP